ncbi:MAG: hypothetical protein GX635_00135 [Synergistaceae bacterium]|nr:hypothetical protein [Synergistaceae bacterium]
MDQRAARDSQLPLAARAKPPSRRTAMPQPACDLPSALAISTEERSVPWHPRVRRGDLPLMRLRLIRRLPRCWGLRDP